MQHDVCEEISEMFVGFLQFVNYKPCPVLRMSNLHHFGMVDDLVDLDLYLVPVIGCRILCHEFLHLYFKLKDQGSTNGRTRE